MMVSACSVRPKDASRPSILTRSASRERALQRQHQRKIEIRDNSRGQLSSKVEGLGSSNGAYEMVLLLDIARHASNGIGIDG